MACMYVLMPLYLTALCLHSDKSIYLKKNTSYVTCFAHLKAFAHPCSVIFVQSPACPPFRSYGNGPCIHFFQVLFVYIYFVYIVEKYFFRFPASPYYFPQVHSDTWSGAARWCSSQHRCLTTRRSCFWSLCGVCIFSVSVRVPSWFVSLCQPCAELGACPGCTLHLLSISRERLQQLHLAC